MTTFESKKPRLAILAPLKAWGGIEGKLVTLGREFLHHGVIPQLVRIRGGEIPYPERMPDGFDVVEIKTRSKWDGVPKVAAFLRRTRPEALLTVKDHSAQVAIMARALSGVEIPVFIKATNTLSVVARRRLQRQMIRFLYPRANRIIAISEGVARDLMENFGIPKEKVVTIYNPVITKDFPCRASAMISHPWLQEENGGPPVIMGAGRLQPQKDFPTLMRAFAQVRRSRPARLIILGEGPERKTLEDLATHLGVREDVDLPGMVSDLLPYMARANVFTLSSRYEGLGNVLVEALAVGTPVVSTNCPSGPSEILEGGYYGPLVPVGDYQKLAQAIKETLEQPQSFDKLKLAVDRFRARPVAERYLEVMGLR
jgi:glycosyltransferase involved in cell wall biosynthesis